MAVYVRAETPDAPPCTAPIARSRLWRACLAGELPAEILDDPRDRERLVRVLWSRGWTDTEIATHTRSTTYTAARIRARLGLERNPKTTGAAA